MWLEDMAWIWLPIVCMLAIWIVWSVVELKRQVHALSKRLAKFDIEATASDLDSERLSCPALFDYLSAK